MTGAGSRRASDRGGRRAFSDPPVLRAGYSAGDTDARDDDAVHDDRQTPGDQSDPEPGGEGRNGIPRRGCRRRPAIWMPALSKGAVGAQPELAGLGTRPIDLQCQPQGWWPSVAPVPQLDGWTEILLRSRWPGK